MMKSIYILCCCTLIGILSSCAAILTGQKQSVDISIPTQGVKLTIDTMVIGTGSSFKPLIKKDFAQKQLKFEAEGYKTKYQAIVPDNRSNWTYLSYFPFAVLAFMPPLIDIVSTNTWLYDDEYSYSPMRKYSYSDSSRKRMFMDNVGFEVNNSNNVFKVYNYKNYSVNGDSITMFKDDSIGIRSTSLDIPLTEVLKKLLYIDTTNTVFIDNVNSIYLNANVRKIVFRGIGYPLFTIHTYFRFLDVQITTEWTAKNVYGDTVYKSRIASTSGQFIVRSLDRHVTETQALADALEYSMLDFIDSLTTNGLATAEAHSTSFKDVISVARPTKPPTSVSDAMKASVTIKDKEGHGSGLLISHDGYIVTNHHVVKKGGEYTVILSDGTEYKAKVIRSNKAIDLALIKIDGNFEVAYSLPEKQNYRVGDEVWTIGTPQSVQLGQSVSKGIVSGSRKYNGSNYVQTDISVNRGNSGGPILLKNGELVAVVEFKLYGRGTEGISFSIPAYEIMQNLGLSY